jgi:hypothetical protein
VSQSEPSTVFLRLLAQNLLALADHFDAGASDGLLQLRQLLHGVPLPPNFFDEPATVEVAQSATSASQSGLKAYASPSPPAHWIEEIRKRSPELARQYETRLASDGQDERIAAEFATGENTADEPATPGDSTNEPPNSPALGLAPLSMESSTKSPSNAPAETSEAATATVAADIHPSSVALVPTAVAPTLDAPTAVAPTVVAPTVVAPTVVAPTVVAPTVVAPTVVAPAAVAPAVVAPTAVAPAAVAPAAVAPAVVAPAIVAPAIVAPAVVAPAVVAPAVVAPAIVAPAIVAPAIVAPAVVAPAVVAPAVVAPAVVAPAVVAPAVVAPAAVAPAVVETLASSRAAIAIGGQRDYSIDDFGTKTTDLPLSLVREDAVISDAVIADTTLRRPAVAEFPSVTNPKDGVSRRRPRLIEAIEQRSPKSSCEYEGLLSPDRSSTPRPMRQALLADRKGTSEPLITVENLERHPASPQSTHEFLETASWEAVSPREPWPVLPNVPTYDWRHALVEERLLAQHNRKLELEQRGLWSE